MSNILYSIAGILIPFVGTSLGSSLVFFLKKDLNDKFEKLILGFATGIMIAASIWSLILPSAEIAENQGVMCWIPATIGIILGVIFLVTIDSIAERVAQKKNEKKINMVLLSVTLHNIPEGMAVGVCFAGFLAGDMGITLLGAMALAIGIAVQNIPEGAIISMPIKMEGQSKGKAFLYGVLSGVVEPIAAFITVLLTNIVVPILPYLLAFAAGAMLFVAIEELVPQMNNGKKSTFGIVGVTIGFVLMMILDMAL